ncbi:D-alanyl-D-alanine carboxypeptidase [Muricauda sp. JGD-17]|uniref:D-alanyl-D-alanine carboxypeptidase n=1 Tax=Flagellimonas ochracea TaxID=2696472 RepID=A0A964T965_9FLAO|nr:D-alanyl-D-alanine carboxypeptidase [Allomuricauda ochracea]NAY90542.1 D-alanyl-D-alanine carboxypeptidase [Allomuricauda ochracea]
MIKTGFKSFNYLTTILLIFYFLFSGCASLKKSLNNDLNTQIFQNSLHGLVISDGKTKKLVYNHHGDTYFTPASNVKIFTFYTGLCLLPKHIPSLRYTVTKDTVYVEGTGNPTWLHPFFKDSTAIRWLKQQSNIALYPNNFEGRRYGPGWAWEDYDTSFSPEISPIPLYGNVVSIYKMDSLKISPVYFEDKVTLRDTTISRNEFSNDFYVKPELDSVQIPFRTSTQLTQNLLEGLLGKKIVLTSQFPAKEKKTLYGMETDSIYKRMLFESDNFLAEQLLITASSTLSDTLSIERAIAHMFENDLSDLENKPRWVDGSGLSRYNLFTPKSMVHVLQKLYDEVPEERLFKLFPMWDVSGTVETGKNPDTDPFIFAKSGSLGNNYNLSGYLKTKSGKLLIFSFMNNHFKTPASEVRQQIFLTLKKLYDRY